MKQIFCRFTIPKSQGASAANVKYIMRETALESNHDAVFLHNLDAYRGSDLRETRTNLTAYAETRLMQERNATRTGTGQTRNHYRCVLSFDRQEQTDKARELTEQFIKENFAACRVIATIHQDTENTHCHLWIDARQVSGKKLDLEHKTFRSIDERWAQIYGKEYGKEYEQNHVEKKLETKQYKKARREWKEVQKPEREAKNADFQKRDLKNYGIDQARDRGNQPDLAIKNPTLERAERAIANAERSFNHALSELRDARESLADLGRGYRQELQQNQELDNDRGRERERVRELEK